MTVTAKMIDARPAPPEVVGGWTSGRLTGTFMMAIWLLVGVGIILFLTSEWDPEKIDHYAPRYFSGLQVTLTLVGISIVLGALVSLPVTYGRMSKSRWLSVPAYGYVYFFRGTPLIAQLYLIYCKHPPNAACCAV